MTTFHFFFFFFFLWRGYQRSETYKNFESILLDEPIPSGPREENLVLIAYASSEGSGEPAHPRSLARTSAARSYRQ